MSAAELVSRLRAEIERLRERIEQLEAIARLNGETISTMQQARRERRRQRAH